MNQTLPNNQTPKMPSSTLQSNTKISSSRLKSNKIHKNQSQFLRSYSQLLNRHFTQSTNQKNNLRKFSSSNQKFRSKTRQDKISNLKKTQTLSKTPSQSNHHPNPSESPLRKTQQIKTNSLENTTKTSFSSSKLKLNPQSTDKIDKILASKTSQIQKNSYQNVILNKKLYQTTVQKNDLSNLIETLKLQILKEKKNKSKISTKMAKLMNKIQQTDSMKKKVETQRKFIDEQTSTINKDVLISREKNKQFQILSDNNQVRINIEKELIKELERKNQLTKVSLNQTRIHLNELKSIYQQESKYLTNTKANFQQVLSEREKFFHVIEQSVTNVNTIKKS